MKKIIAILFTICCLSYFSFAQTIVAYNFSPIGQNSILNNASIDYFINIFVPQNDNSAVFHSNLFITENQKNDNQLNKQTILQGFRYFPNPAIDYLNIFFEFEAKDTKFCVQVFDFQGVERKKIEIMVEKQSDLQMQIDLSDFPTGVYLVKLNANNILLSSFKIVKK